MDLVADGWILANTSVEASFDSLTKEGNRHPAKSEESRILVNLEHLLDRLAINWKRIGADLRRDTVEVRVAQRDPDKCPDLPDPMRRAIDHYECRRGIAEANLHYPASNRGDLTDESRLAKGRLSHGRRQSHRADHKAR